MMQTPAFEMNLDLLRATLNEIAQRTVITAVKLRQNLGKTFEQQDIESHIADLAQSKLIDLPCLDEAGLAPTLSSTGVALQQRLNVASAWTKAQSIVKTPEFLLIGSSGALAASLASEQQAAPQSVTVAKEQPRAPKTTTTTPRVEPWSVMQSH